MGKDKGKDIECTMESDVTVRANEKGTYVSVSGPDGSGTLSNVAVYSNGMGDVATPYRMTGTAIDHVDTRGKGDKKLTIGTGKQGSVGRLSYDDYANIYPLTNSAESVAIVAKAMQNVGIKCAKHDGTIAVPVLSVNDIKSMQKGETVRK